MQRTFEPLRTADLDKIRELSIEELQRFLCHVGNPPGKYSCYKQRLLAVCLAQGAAQHFTDLAGHDGIDLNTQVGIEKIREKGFRVLVDGQVISGVKDVDVWFFFSSDNSIRIPPRRHCRKTSLCLLPNLGERSVDFMKKEVPSGVVREADINNAREVVRSYLLLTSHGREHLSKKSVIGLFPDIAFGQILWHVRRHKCATTPPIST